MVQKLQVLDQPPGNDLLPTKPLQFGLVKPYVSSFMASLPPPPTTASRAAAKEPKLDETRELLARAETTIHSAGTHSSRSA
jgi:hypothetical protein